MAFDRAAESILGLVQTFLSVDADGSGAFWADRLDGLRRHTVEGKVVELTRSEIQQLLQSVPELKTTQQRLLDLDADHARLRTAFAKAQAGVFWAKMGFAALAVMLLVATVGGKIVWHLF